MLQEIDNNLWCVPGELWMGSKMLFTLRMVVVRLSGGGLVLISPVAMDDEVVEQLKALGPVEALVAPNCYHHLYMKDAAARFPEAKVWLAPGLDKKRPDLRHDGLLDDQSPLWPGELEQILIEGAPALGETIFFHRPTGTMIVTDLIFNVQQTQGWLTPWVLRAMGTYRKATQSRAWSFITKDRAAAAASLERALQWPITRLVMAHGDILEGVTPEDVRRACPRTLPAS